jgi:hypothetical protein
MNCWICGNAGNTGEHLIKASDLRSQFGKVSQNFPLYYHTSDKKNIPVGSTNSKRLKSKALICNTCNSSTTQPYDKAWEKLSIYLRNNICRLNKNGNINLSKVFPGTVKKSMLDVHLYFLKVFGCIIVENEVPISINEFGNCILQREAHKNIFIAFGQNPSTSKINHAGFTPVHSVNKDDKSVFASWGYVVENIAVNIIYADEFKNPVVMKNTWHPSMVQKHLRIKQY